MAVRTLALWCRDWPVVAAGHAPDEPVAVVFANRVVACSPAARAEGVRVDQRRREAQGRCPDVVVLERDLDRDARAFEAVVAALEAVTPRIEIGVAGWAAFGTRGPSRYFGGDDALAALVHARVAEVLDERGWPATHVRVGVADGPFAARLAAQRCGRTAAARVVPDGESAPFLAPLPVRTLQPPELVDVLRRLGLRTLGDLAALDAADVVARFGVDGQRAHRLAAGLDEHPPATTDPPADLVVAAELDPPAERVDTAAFTAKVLADELLAGLERLALTCTRVAVFAETEHGETIERLWRHEGGLDAAALTDRVRWQLDGWLNGSAARRPTSGIALLRLAPDEVIPAVGRQLGFWGAEAAAADRAARALARVQGLLGADAARVPEWVGGRGPGDQVRLVPAHAVDLASSSRATTPATLPAPWPGQVPPPSPANVHPTPIPAMLVDADGAPVQVSGRGMASAAPARLAIGVEVTGRGDAPPVPAGAWRDVVAWAGPWPCEERWWDEVSRRRRARVQVVTDEAHAHLVVLEGGRWWIEATYD